MILTVTLNPSVDHTVFLPSLLVGDTNRVEHVEIDAGGKGINVSRIVAELGEATLATGFLGGANRRVVDHILDRQGVQRDFVHVREATRTNFSIETSDNAPPTTLNMRGPHISLSEWSEFLVHYEKALPEAKWVAMGGSIPPGVPLDAYRILAETAGKFGVKTVVDADGEPMKHGLDAKPDFIKPNRHEAERLLGRSLPTINDVAHAALELRTSLTEQSIVIISLGAEGAVMATDQGIWRGESPVVETKSTIGSGDSLIGGVLVGLVRNLPHDQGLKLGLACGAATAMSDGTTIGRRADIDRLFDQAVVRPL